MPATIKIKNSSTASAVPTSSDLVQGELAVNVTDKRIFTENASGTVVELGTNPSILTLPDGSESSPTLTNDGDTNTGLFFPAADTVGISTGGTERARVDSSGNLGLGVTPSAWSSSWKAVQLGGGGSLAVWATDAGTNLSANAYNDGSWKRINAATVAQYSMTSTGEHRWNIAGSSTAGSTISFTQAMTLDASGNLGVGVTSPAAPLHIYSSAQEQVRLGRNSSSSSAYLTFFANNSSSAQVQYAGILGDVASSTAGSHGGNLLFYTTGSGTSAERARIDSSGRLLVGTTGALVNESAFGATSSGNTSCFKTTGGAGVSAILVWNSGTSGTRDLIQFSTGSSYSGLGSINTNGSTITYGGTSDYRLKENIAPMTGALATIAQLKPCTFTWKNTGIEDNGFIAHELQEVCPNAVVGEKDAVNEDGSIKPQQIDTSFLVATLTAAIQELKAEFDAYKASHP